MVNLFDQNACKKAYETPSVEIVATTEDFLTGSPNIFDEFWDNIGGGGESFGTGGGNETAPRY